MQCSQRLFQNRTKKEGKAYGMFMSALRTLLQGAYAPPTSPGQSVPGVSPVGIVLIKFQFLNGVAPAVTARLRLYFSDATLQKLPQLQCSGQIEEAFGLRGQTMHLCQVGEGATETNQTAELWREVQSLSEAVSAIRAPAAGRGGAHVRVWRVTHPVRGGGGIGPLRSPKLLNRFQNSNAIRPNCIF